MFYYMRYLRTSIALQLENIDCYRSIDYYQVDDSHIFLAWWRWMKDIASTVNLSFYVVLFYFNIQNCKKNIQYTEHLHI